MWGFRVSGLGFRVEGLGWAAKIFMLRVWGVEGLG